MEAGMFAIRGNRDVVLNDDFVNAMKKVLGERSKNLNEMSTVMFA
jgi:ATP-dependent 26S proteasome regulatory subunit